MDEIVRMLCDELLYLKHEIENDSIVLSVSSKNKSSKCPYCSHISNKVHSRYTRKLQDLPIQGKKVKLHINRKKYFCVNKECSKRTFAEKFNFFDERERNTKRLKKEILQLSLTQSSISASRYLKASVADVGKSTICNLLKKGHE